MNTDQKRKKIGRKRRVAGWMLLTLGLLVAGVWVGSARWFSLQIHRSPYTVEVTFGCLCLDSFSYLSPPAPSAEPRSGWSWSLHRKYDDDSAMWSWFGSDGNQRMQTSNWGIFQRAVSRYRDNGATYGEMTHRTFVLWPIPLLLWTPAALLLRSGIVARRRAQSGKCKKCGYDLAGLATGALCPECGTVLSGAERMKAGSEVERSNGPPQ